MAEPTHDERLLARLDRFEDGMSSRLGRVEIQLGALITEVREVAVLQRAHDARDEDRFAGVHSDLRRLRDRVTGVEDTSRREAIEVARAHGSLSEGTKTAKEWRKTIITLVVVVVLSASGTLGAQEALQWIGGM